MAMVPVTPLPPPASLHILRRNTTTATTLRSPPMVAAVMSQHFLGFPTYNKSFEFKSLSQMMNPAFLSRRRRVSTVVSSAGNLTAPSSWESWKPDKKAVATPLLLSDVIWPAAGCAAIGVVAFSVFGPGWLARSVALAVSIAFMVIARANHPPAASLPLMFIDGAKFHHLNFWYTLFPGAAACVILCLLQSIVSYMKDNIKF